MICPQCQEEHDGSYYCKKCLKMIRNPYRPRIRSAVIPEPMPDRMTSPSIRARRGHP